MPTIEGLEGRLTLAGTLSLGTPAVLPATIQAETFGLNAAEVAYRNATAANQGGAFRATTPAAPTGLSAVATAATSVALSWTDNAVGESGSTIERKLGVGGSYSTLATLAANVTSLYRHDGGREHAVRLSRQGDHRRQRLVVQQQSHRDHPGDAPGRLGRRTVFWSHEVSSGTFGNRFRRDRSPPVCLGPGR